MHKSQKGFTIVELVIGMVVIGLLGFAGWTVYKNNHKIVSKVPDTTNSQTSTTQTNSGQEMPIIDRTSSTVQNTDKSYLVIKDWGIKVKLENADASLVEYAYTDTANNIDGVFGPVVSFVSLQLNDSVTKDTKCKKLGLVIARQLTGDGKWSNGYDHLNNLGSYSYGISGNPASCGDATLDKIRAQYTGNHPGSWSYSYIN